MLSIETACWEKGRLHIAGVDEVGRGCLFGDVYAAAVIMPVHLVAPGVKDSKRMTAKQRNKAFDYLCDNALCLSIGRASAEEVDTINIRQATKLAMRRAVEGLALKPDVILVDSESIEGLGVEQISIVHGDALSQSIAAASIIAKVMRDRQCELWDEQYPQYGIRKHKGYGTEMHMEAIRDWGISSMHRRSFLSKFSSRQLEINFDTMVIE